VGSSEVTECVPLKGGIGSIQLLPLSLSLFVHEVNVSFHWPLP
jgi:hypothetical protein